MHFYLLPASWSIYLHYYGVVVMVLVDLATVDAVVVDNDDVVAVDYDHGID